jgi:hypothetical protein
MFRFLFLITIDRIFNLFSSYNIIFGEPIHYLYKQSILEYLLMLLLVFLKFHVMVKLSFSVITNLQNISLKHHYAKTC